MKSPRCFILLWLAVACWSVAGEKDDALFPDVAALPRGGERDLRAVTPYVLELRGVEALTGWNREEGSTVDLRPEDFAVTVNSEPRAVRRVGGRRMPIYADYHAFDLRVLDQIFVEMVDPLAPGR